MANTADHGTGDDRAARASRRSTTSDPATAGSATPQSAPLSEDPMTVLYHELKSPLGLIATLARSAAIELDGLRAREHFEAINRVAERTLRTADIVLAVARAADQQPTVTCCRPAEVLERLVGDMQELGCDVQLDIDESSVNALVESVGMTTPFGPTVMV